MPMYGPTHSVPIERREASEEAAAREVKNQASGGATKIVYILMAIVLFAFLLMTVIGPHIPAGE